jgi:hypothetical protein
LHQSICERTEVRGSRNYHECGDMILVSCAKAGTQASSASASLFSYQVAPQSKGHITLALCMRQSVVSYKFYLRQCITPQLTATTIMVQYLAN